MQIWILLQHKYFRTSKVDISARRFNFKPRDEIKDGNAVSSDGADHPPVGQEFPVYFSEAESDPIMEISLEIGKTLQHLFKNTNEVAPVGNVAQYLEKYRWSIAQNE